LCDVTLTFIGRFSADLRMHECKAANGGAAAVLDDSDPAATARRMEGYMEQALHNIHAEESEHISNVLLQDVEEKILRQMLVSRLEQWRQEQEAREQMGLKDGPKKDVSSSSGGGGKQHQKKKKKSLDNHLTSLISYASTSSLYNAPFIAASTEKDAHVYTKEEVVTHLKAMLVQDILHVRMQLERKEIEKQKKQKGSPPNGARTAKVGGYQGDMADATVAAAASSAGASSAVGAGEEAMLSIEEEESINVSEAIVEMVEKKYGTQLYKPLVDKAEADGT
jgi:stalled ribosome alternative rescue factor ArfA